jgi:hypothetical protein
MRGNLDPDALKPGEFILKPGLVYRLVLPNPSAFRHWRALKSICSIQQHRFWNVSSRWH